MPMSKKECKVDRKMEAEKRIYFDNGSTSWPKAPNVAEAIAGLLANGAFNINRGNYEGAYEVEGIPETSWRGCLAQMIPEA